MNSLGIDLIGKTVVIKAEVMPDEYADEKRRLFKVDGGFGARSFTMGSALMGVWLEDGERDRMDGNDVERVWEDPA